MHVNDIWLKYQKNHKQTENLRFILLIPVKLGSFQLHASCQPFLPAALVPPSSQPDRWDEWTSLFSLCV